jgi:hypothetical protein
MLEKEANGTEAKLNAMDDCLMNFLRDGFMCLGIIVTGKLVNRRIV